MGNNSGQMLRPRGGLLDHKAELARENSGPSCTTDDLLSGAYPGWKIAGGNAPAYGTGTGQRLSDQS